MNPPLPPGWKCPRRVGFLFPHDCRRTTPVDCPDCRNGQVDDPYAGRQRWGYHRYDYFDDDYFFGYDLFRGGPIDADFGGDMTADPASADFTESDGADLVQPDGQPDGDFENDMTGS